ncbi:PspC domain-containing protein [Kineosporia sp. J2-2]|uniref:PspC domain-containing protein n=1 Tax=Kineosporia corallincola TaxID=2835133 RepID=A0ABS5TA27_9ACTN|nr:PspC domain-containing protein [Kineosporia corallincola]MBT0767920.1 PspC domain-containing protein [Kineosporia corallincola]
MSGTQDPGGDAWGSPAQPSSHEPAGSGRTGSGRTGSERASSQQTSSEQAGGPNPAADPNPPGETHPAGEPNQASRTNQTGGTNQARGTGHEGNSGHFGGGSGPGTPDEPPTGWGPPPEPGSPQHRTGDEFFGRIRDLGAARPTEGRWVAGVASGLSRRLDIDQTLIRGTFVALTIVGGLGVALYGLCWMFLPRLEDGRIHLQEAIRGRFSPGFFAAGLMSLAAIGGGGPWSHDGVWFWGFPGTLVVAALIVGGLWWAARKLPQPPHQGVPNTGVTGGVSSSTGSQSGTGAPHWTTPEGSRQLADNAARWGRQTGDAAAAWGRQTGDAASAWARDFSQQRRTAHEEAAHQRWEAQRAARARTAPSRRVRQLTLGLALVAATGVLIAEFYGDLPGWAGLTALGVAIVVIACGVIANGLMGRRSPGLAGLGILLTLFLSLGAAAQHAGVDTTKHLAAVGAATWTPQNQDEARSQYNLGIGEATLDLTSPGVLAGASASNPLEVEVNLGVGHLVLNLPDSVTVQVQAHLGAGEVLQPDGSRYEVKGDSGQHDRTLTYGSDAPVVKVVAQQGVGQLEINREALEGEN